MVEQKKTGKMGWHNYRISSPKSGAELTNGMLVWVSSSNEGYSHWREIGVPIPSRPLRPSIRAPTNPVMELQRKKAGAGLAYLLNAALEAK